MSYLNNTNKRQYETASGSAKNMKYKVTLYLEANTHPRKWIPDTVWEALDSGEDILDYHIEQIKEKKLKKPLDNDDK